MKILVTGGAGFMGSDFVRTFVRKYPKNQVVVLDKLTYAGNLGNLKEIKERKNFEFIKGDIGDASLVNKLMKGVEVVFHFAAETHVDRSILDPQVFIKTNVLGTQTLLDFALKNRIKRFHHISTDEVFGFLPLNSKEKFTVKSPYKPGSPYAASKAAADHLVRAYFVTFGLPIIITNSSNNFGPYQYPEKFVSLSITNALENKKIPIYGDGQYTRDWLFVEDHTSAVMTTLEKGKIGETYLISADNEYMNIDLAKKILRVLKKDESLIEFVRDRPGHDRRYALDGSKIKKLGWEPKNSFDKALEATIKWYQKNPSWWKKLKRKPFADYFKVQ